MPRFTRLQDWLAWQETLHPRSIDLGLDRVRAVARALGIGSTGVLTITVGGTNGKGSATALLDAILTSAGHRTATFTSPHLFRYNERIRIAGKPIDDETLVEAFGQIDAARGGTSLTFFEFNTLAALLAFREAAPEVVILEVGLGGRLDAVNIVDADVALLMSVAVDHTDWLGESLEEIGLEKAGIFRHARPAILGEPGMPGSVLDAARAIGADVRVPPLDFSYEVCGEGWNWRGRARSFDQLPAPALAGLHQLQNASAVLAALESLGTRVQWTRGAVVDGLRHVNLPGRFEVVPGDVEWVFDVAHNPAAAAALAATLASRQHKGRTLAVVGILKDKDAAGIVVPVEKHIDRWIAADLQGARGMNGEDLKDAVSALTRAPWSTARSVDEACELAAKQALRGDRILVFGSFHTVGPAREWRARR